MPVFSGGAAGCGVGFISATSAGSICWPGRAVGSLAAASERGSGWFHCCSAPNSASTAAADCCCDGDSGGAAIAMVGRIAAGVGCGSGCGIGGCAYCGW